jgi:tRNA A37 threonylcarbamoyltransferase TsaD
MEHQTDFSSSFSGLWKTAEAYIEQNRTGQDSIAKMVEALCCKLKGRGFDSR